jgi:hypothetical protein
VQHASEALTPYFGDQIYIKAKSVIKFFALFSKETDGLKKFFIFAPALQDKRRQVNKDVTGCGHYDF